MKTDEVKGRHEILRVIYVGRISAILHGLLSNTNIRILLKKMGDPPTPKSH